MVRNPLKREEVPRLGALAVASRKGCGWRKPLPSEGLFVAPGARKELMAMFYVIHFIVWQLVFGFQRKTLGVARKVANPTGLTTSQIQTALTPNWMGTLGWINSGMSLAGVLAAYFNFGFLAAIVFVFAVYLGGYSIVSPIFDGLLSRWVKQWMKDGLKGYSTSPAGYLTTLSIERAMKEDDQDAGK